MGQKEGKSSRYANFDRVRLIERCYWRRIRLGLSRSELAGFMKLSYSTLEKWERFDVIPDIRKLFRYRAWVLRCERGEVSFTRYPEYLLLGQKRESK